MCTSMAPFIFVACLSSFSAAIYLPAMHDEENHDSDLLPPSVDDVKVQDRHDPLSASNAVENGEMKKQDLAPDSIYSSALEIRVKTANLGPRQGHVPRDASSVNARHVAVDADGKISWSSESSERKMTAHYGDSDASSGSDDGAFAAPAPSTHASMVQVTETDARVQPYDSPARSKFYHWLVDPIGRAPIVETSLLRQETWGVDDAAITRTQAARDLASRMQETMTIRQRLMENEGAIAGCVGAGIFIVVVGVFGYRRYTEHRIKHRTQDLRTATPQGQAVPRSPREKASESGTSPQSESQPARLDYAALRARPGPSK
eukprot:GEMP01027025.1.p1 GENE.GEMP01027025.1~~GEMP01027025.1.p1  ORF type:complete len:318 (+),score=71.07 GEMP01027025.1:189-1142(+)